MRVEVNLGYDNKLLKTLVILDKILNKNKNEYKFKNRLKFFQTFLEGENLFTVTKFFVFLPINFQKMVPIKRQLKFKVYPGMTSRVGYSSI